MTSEIFSSRKHSMDYVTFDGVKLRTGYADKKYWYILTVKELLDNAIDFLWKHYGGADNAAIDVDITKDDKLLRIKVSNTNDKDIEIFQNLDLVFNFEIRYGSKQNEYIISRGMLGDAMKQILAFGYVLIHLDDDGNGFADRQWEHPLIIRHNKQEWKVLLHVDKAKEEILATRELSNGKLRHTQTEIEVVLPAVADLDIDELESFCKMYPLLTTDISFKFRLVDNSSNQAHPQEVRYVESTKFKGALEEQLVETLSSPPPKAAIKIEYPALHPISTEWNNISSVHFYKKEEFLNRLVRVHNKLIRVYDVLKTFREGTNMPKRNPDNDISIGELISHQDRDKKVEQLYNELKTTLPAPFELSFPYKNTKQQRQIALVDRIMRLYPELDPHKAVYKIATGNYHDEWLDYPFIFEIIAIPYSTKVLDIKDEHRASKFIGNINYSMSPRGNTFEGYYSWTNKKNKQDIYDKDANSAREMLSTEGFSYYANSGTAIKLPSIILANLVSPRVDYHGHDKSRIDTKPFVPVIMDALHKIGIQTFRAAGYIFQSESSRRHDFAKPVKKMRTEDALEQFLMTIRDGLA